MNTENAEKIQEWIDLNVRGEDCEFEHLELTIKTNNTIYWFNSEQIMFEEFNKDVNVLENISNIRVVDEEEIKIIFHTEAVTIHKVYPYEDWLQVLSNEGWEFDLMIELERRALNEYETQKMVYEFWVDNH
ncbi:hypothetical protein P0Y35_16135 [Kiritimatiellaeota bacterium B1221]|nr:hypothetical protein [Kiritimatiellaeota bacterium B1221]